MFYENFALLENQRNVNIFIPVFMFVKKMLNFTQ